MFVCEHDEIIGCVKTDVLSICQFDFILIYDPSSMCLSIVQIKRTQFEIKEKLAEMPHMSQLSLIKNVDEGYKLVHVRKYCRCRIV